MERTWRHLLEQDCMIGEGGGALVVGWAAEGLAGTV